MGNVGLGYIYMLTHGLLHSDALNHVPTYWDI